jgi:hypothetical protein
MSRAEAQGKNEIHTQSKQKNNLQYKSSAENL